LAGHFVLHVIVASAEKKFIVRFGICPRRELAWYFRSRGFIVPALGRDYWGGGVTNFEAIGLSELQLGLLVAIAVIAGIVRGYSGFGFSAIVIAGASLVIPPAAVVPALFMLEIAASIHMLPAVRRDIDYPNFWPMLAGCAIGLPVGQYLLVHLEPDAVRFYLAWGVLISAVLIWRGISFDRSMNRPLATLTGFLTGFGSGLASIGGLFAMVVFLGTRYPPAHVRAIFVAMFFAMYVYGVGLSAYNGLVSATTAFIALTLLVPMILGIVIGQRQYLSSTPEAFRRFALLLLMALASAGILRIVLL
jgi:uncharacterized membrane protein YfcA